MRILRYVYRMLLCCVALSAWLIAPNAKAEVSHIVCDGIQVVESHYDGQIHEQSREPYSENFKLGDNTINGDPCTETGDTYRVCKSSKLPTNMPPTEKMYITHFASSEILNLYSGMMNATVYTYFSDGSEQWTIFKGKCRKSKKMF